MLFRGFWVFAFGPHYIDYGLLVGTDERPLLIEAEIFLNTGRMDDPFKHANQQRYPLGIIAMNPANYVRIVPVAKEEDLSGKVDDFRRALGFDLPDGAWGA